MSIGGGGIGNSALHNYLFGQYGLNGQSSTPSSQGVGGSGIDVLNDPTVQMPTTGGSWLNPAGMDAGQTANYQGQLMKDPSLAIQSMFAGSDSNNPYLQTLQSLASGLGDLFNFTHSSGGETGQLASNMPLDFLTHLPNYISQGTTPGSLSAALGNLLSGGTGIGDLAGYIQSMSPNDIMNAIIDMANAAGFGHLSPQLLQGIQYQAQQAASQWAPEWAKLQAVPTGTALPNQAVAFTSWLRQHAPGLMGSLGI